MRKVNVLGIGVFFAILPFPILLQTEAAECTQPEYTCLQTCAGLPTLDEYEACSTSCNAQHQAAMAQYNQCVQGPSEPNASQPAFHASSSSSSSSSSQSTHTPTPKTTIYKFGDLKEGDRVTTGKGERATISLDSRGSRVELEPNSAFIVMKTDEYQTLKGKFAFFFKKLSRELNIPYRVRTPMAVFAVRGTKFLTSVTRTKTVVQVLEGLVRVSNLKGTQSVDVSAGYQTTVTKTKLQAPKPFTERQLITPQ